MKVTFEAALVDVGGTLWPNSIPRRASDGQGRLLRVGAALDGVDPLVVERLVADMVERSRFGDAAPSTEAQTSSIGADAETLVAACLVDHGLDSGRETVARVRRAMALPVKDRMQPLPGAPELLAKIHELGLRCVIASNTYWRDAQSYRDDFMHLGMGDHIDAIVTSVDAGRMKPDKAVFELAMRTAGTSADRCIVIGNKEDNDILPALSLGMQAILVYPDDPEPVSSRAHATAPDLWTCASLLEAMLRNG